MLSLLKNDLKNLKNTIVIFSGILLLCLIITLISFNKNIPLTMFYLTALIYALVIPIVNLSYLFNHSKRTHYMSLPFTKTQSFSIRYLSGLVSVVVPILLCCFVEMLLGDGNIVKNLGSMLLMIWFYYNVSNLATYLTTNIIMDIVLQIVIIIAPFIICYSLFILYQAFAYGFVASISLEAVSLVLPAVRLFQESFLQLSAKYCLIYLGYGLIVFALAYISCLKREYECNYHGFAYKIVGEAIKIVCIVTLSWLITAVLNEYNQSIKHFVIINIIVTFISTFVIQFIQTKKIKYVLCIIQGAIICIFTIGITVGSKDFIENYIPDNIESVTLDINKISESYSKVKMTNQKDIENVIAIHKNILSGNKEYGDYYVTMTYNTKGGNEVTRAYNINKKEYLKMVEQMDSSLVKQIFKDYYYLIDHLDEYVYFDYFIDDNPVADQIKEKNDLFLFKNILVKQLNEFVDNPDLLKEVSRSYHNLSGYKTNNNDAPINICYMEKDPMDRAINEYHKIKAN